MTIQEKLQLYIKLIREKKYKEAEDVFPLPLSKEQKHPIYDIDISFSARSHVPDLEKSINTFMPSNNKVTIGSQIVEDAFNVKISNIPLYGIHITVCEMLKKGDIHLKGGVYLKIEHVSKITIGKELISS
jgi:hypothetical protein